MSIITGKQGSILANGQRVAEVTQWSLLGKARTVAYSSSATAGQIRRIVTSTSATGTLTFRADRLAPQQDQLAVGQSVELQLILEEGTTRQLSAVIEQLELMLDVDRADGVVGKVNFVSDGAV